MQSKKIRNLIFLDDCCVLINDQSSKNRLEELKSNNYKFNKQQQQHQKMQICNMHIY